MFRIEVLELHRFFSINNTYALLHFSKVCQVNRNPFQQLANGEGGGGGWA